MKHFLVYPGLFMEGQQFANTINKTPRGESLLDHSQLSCCSAQHHNTVSTLFGCSTVISLCWFGAGQYDMRRLVSL